MITAIIIDDEPSALDVLHMQLRQFCPEVKVLELCNSGIRGIEAIRQHQPQLVFLDIEMPHVTGFDVLAATAQLDYLVVFTTAYDQFAIKAFKYAAVDYLLKPVDADELIMAVERASRFSQKQDLAGKLSSLLKNLQPSAQRIALPADNGMQLVNPTDIVRCESDSNYTTIFLLSGKKIVTAKTLKDVEESLAGFSFFRIHQSHLINTAHVVQIIKGEGGSVIMQDGASLPLSRTKKEAFLEIFRKL